MAKCRFIGKCPWYNKDNNLVTCEETAGMYYGRDRPAGCYREMERKEKMDGNIINPFGIVLIIMSLFLISFTILIS